LSARRGQNVVGWLGLSLMLLSSVPAQAFDPLQRAERAVQRSRTAFAAGDTSTAIDEMLRAQALAPDDPRIRHALGEIYYEGQEFSSSQRVFEGLLHDKELRADAPALRSEELLYNSANAAFEQQQYEQALEFYTEALMSADPTEAVDENLLHNLELTQTIIEMQESQEHSGEGEPNEDQQEDSEDSSDPNQQKQEGQSQEEQQSEQEQQDQQQEQEQQNDEGEEGQASADSTQSQPSESDSMSVAEMDSLPQLPEGMTPQEAMRLLEALDHDEEELRRSIQRRLRGGETESTSEW
jgi:Ca-activated chloride channel homolog